MFDRFFVSLYFLLIVSFSSAQETKVTGHFTVDSIQLGKPISYYLAVRYPQHSTIVFPDSSFSFAPFEFQKKKFFATETKNGISYDTVVFTLASFEIDSVQTLRLPVFEVHEKDCTAVFALTDTVFFDKLVKSLPDTVQLSKVPLKSNTNYFKVSWILNYPLVSLIVGIIIFLLLMSWIIFGKRIRKYFKIKKLIKTYQAFVDHYKIAVENAQTNFSSPSTEAALLVWKKYLESLLDKPYTKYTTKEIRKSELNERLGDSLSAIDRMIYANSPGDYIHFDRLKDYSNDQFHKKLEEVKNG